MPSLWKKAKGGNRLSRLMADLQSPPKRGGSLVVETGFPTSLVDLFVKNRDRLKKPSKKKSHNTHPPPPQPPPPTPEVSISNGSSGYSDGGCSKLEEPSCSNGEEIEEIEGIEEMDCKDGNCSDVVFVLKSGRVLEFDRDEEEKREVLKVNEVSLWVLKVALVVILVLFIKKFVLGITVSAFLLVLLEYVGHHVFGFLKPCPILMNKLNPLFYWIRSHLGRNSNEDSIVKIEFKSCPNSGEITMYKGQVEQGDCVSVRNVDSIDEIQAVETIMPGVCVIERFERGSTSCNNGEGQGKVELELRKELMREEEEVILVKKKGKFWKKMVPKKIRSRKKKKKKNKRANEEEHESSSSGFGVPSNCIVEDNPVSSEEEEEDNDEQAREITNEDGSHALLASEEQENNEEITRKVREFNGSSSSYRDLFQSTNNGTRSKCLFIVLVALAGLLGGQIIAVGITVLSCFMFKIVRRGSKPKNVISLCS